MRNEISTKIKVPGFQDIAREIRLILSGDEIIYSLLSILDRLYYFESAISQEIENFRYYPPQNNEEKINLALTFFEQSQIQGVIPKISTTISREESKYSSNIAEESRKSLERAVNILEYDGSGSINGQFLNRLGSLIVTVNENENTYFVSQNNQSAPQSSGLFISKTKEDFTVNYLLTGTTVLNSEEVEASSIDIEPEIRGCFFESVNKMLSNDIFAEAVLQPLLIQATPIPTAQLFQEKNIFSIASILSTVEKEKIPTRISFDTNTPLTPLFMKDIVFPYIESIIEIQKIIDEANKRKTSPIEIISIKKGSLNVELSGGKEAVDLIKEATSKWRKEHAEKMAELEREQKAVEIQRSEGELRELNAKTSKELGESEKLLAEAELIKAQAEKQRIENQKAELELFRAKFELITEMINKAAPNLSESERLMFGSRLLKYLDTIIASPLLPKDDE